MANSIESEDKTKKKAKNGLDTLNDLYPGCAFNLVGQYGAAEQFQMIYVMEVEIESQVFQGIGYSKRKAKIMAAENALIFLGKCDKLTEDPENLREEPYCWNDFTADIIDNNSTLFHDFSELPDDAKNDEDDMDEWIEALTYDGDERRHMIGRNTLSILSELHPESTYRLISAVVERHRVYFVMSVLVNNMEFKGSGPSKKLARARAAREALKTIYKIDFGVLEDGMPVYEGDEQIWKMYKKKLEEQALKADYYNPITNPIKQLNEFYPDMKITFPYMTDHAIYSRNFVAQTFIDGQVFESSGTNKKLAKTNLARHIISILKDNGIYDKKIEELNERKRLKDKKSSDKPKMFDGTKSAVSKLNDIRPELEYRVVAETPLKNTCITAFTVVVHVDDKIHVGVGKNKKTAKLEAAEKALRELGVWDEEDENAKMKSKIELMESDVYQDGNGGKFALNAANTSKKPLDLMEMAKQDMSRQDIMRLVKTQLGLNAPSFNKYDKNFRNPKRKRDDPRSQFDDMLDELDSLVDNILETRGGNRGEPFMDFSNRFGGNKNFQNRRNNFSGNRNFDDNISGNNYNNRGYGNNQQRFQNRPDGPNNWNTPPPLIPPDMLNKNNRMSFKNNNNNNNNSNNFNNNNINNNNTGQYNYNYNQGTWADLTKPMKWPGPANTNSGSSNTNNVNSIRNITSNIKANTNVNTNFSANTNINTHANINTNTNVNISSISSVNRSITSTSMAMPQTTAVNTYNSNYNANFGNNYNYNSNPYGAYQPYWNNTYNQTGWDASGNYMYPQYPPNTGDPSYYTGQQNNFDWNSTWNSSWNGYYNNTTNTTTQMKR